MRGILFGFVMLVVAVPAGAADMSELATIKWQMIKQSASIYKGAQTNSVSRNCPCPDDRMMNDKRCGWTSAWCRPGEHQDFEPLCYLKEIPDSIAREYQASPRRDFVLPQANLSFRVRISKSPRCSGLSGLDYTETSALSF